MNYYTKIFLFIALFSLAGCIGISDESDLISETMNMEFDEDNPFFTERANYFGNELNQVEVGVWYYNIHERGTYAATITSCDGLEKNVDFISSNMSNTLLNEQSYLYKLDLQFRNVPTATYTCEVILRRSDEVVETTRFTARP